MDTRMNRWTGGWMDDGGRMDRWIDGQVNDRQLLLVAYLRVIYLGHCRFLLAEQ